MTVVEASAPGKVILAGEHAVVYHRPAIAVPVWERVARARIHRQAAGSGCILAAPDVGREVRLVAAGDDDALAVVTRATLAWLGLPQDPDWRIELTSAIPIAAGMGSGAALSAALVRAIHAQAGVTPDPAVGSALVYRGGLHYNGTPSGIGKNVVAYCKPGRVFKGTLPEVFTPGAPFQLVIADSGIPSPTRTMVEGVRRRRAADPVRYGAWFDEIGGLVLAARVAIEAGATAELGSLFDRNHALLAQIGVSTPLLDRLVAAARAAGAAGAKLSGGGGGGNLIALVDAVSAPGVVAALQAAGAVRVLVTTVAA